jgi:hypothetical protein
MKLRIAVAIIVGLSISVLLAALQAELRMGLLEYLQAPGVIAIMLMWGPHGPVPVPDIVVDAIGIGVNAVVYSLITLGVFRLFDHAKMAPHNPKDG